MLLVSDEKEWSALQNDTKDRLKNPEALGSKTFFDIDRYKKISSELAEVSVRTICRCVNKDLKLLPKNL